MSTDQSEYPHECCECGSPVMAANQLCDRCLFDDPDDDEDLDIDLS
jgi:NMD protein affecting ribosome stability and mRNA decay